MSRAVYDYNSIDWNSLFEYSPESKTGLIWKEDRLAGRWMKIVAAKKGTEAGTIQEDTKKGTKYATVSTNGKNWFAHRAIWIMHHGYTEPNMVIDHIDGNSLNNDINNLRKVPQKLNNRNASLRKDNSTGIGGVHFTESSNSKYSHTYATATWYENIKDGKTSRKCKHFSVLKYGLIVAYAKATEFRKSIIDSLNNTGSGYSSTHGKKKN